MSAEYLQLEALFTRVYQYEHVLNLLFWDSNVCMPPKGAESRGNAIAQINQDVHNLIADPATHALLEKAEAVKGELTELQQANLREMRRVVQKESNLPQDFVTRKARLLSQSRLAWTNSRATNDFAAFLPTLQQVLDIAREEARYHVGDSGQSPYEALFNQYEPGMRLSTVEALFADVKTWLPGLLRRVVDMRERSDEKLIPLQTPIPIEKQKELNLALMRVFNFDFDAGRLDVSAHPFSGNTKEDSRITTFYNEHSYTKTMFATIHETGHTKYETNCGFPAMRGQPVDHARSLGIHESQSLFAERMIGRSAAFAEFVTPLLIEHLGPQPAFTVDNVRRLHQHVNPGYIRVEADEVCYTLHVILRYEIERALIEGSMEAADVPRVWNEKMQEYLGLETLGRDDVGCLQDIHWSVGFMGYFPTYSLGAMTAAQLMASIRRELGSETVDKYIRAGNMKPIQDKQAEKIWSHGCFYSTEDLIVKATGEPLTTKYFREHLERRYLHNAD